MSKPAAPGSRPPLDETVTDAAILEWRQGDVIEFSRFVHQKSGDPDHLLASVSTATEKLVVVTQTCDIVRPVSRRPFVQLAAVVSVDEGRARKLREGTTPHLIHLPALGPNAFADLDRVMTWEKQTLVAYERAPAVRDEDERRKLRDSIGRKFSRFPFPDDFTISIEWLRDRIIDKHDKPVSAEGRLLRQVMQIRATANPDWDSAAASIDLTFVLEEGQLPSCEGLPEPSDQTRKWFDEKPRDSTAIAEKICAIMDGPADATGRDEDIIWLWSRLVEAWLARCTPTGAIRELGADVVNGEEFGLIRYLNSEQLDLDYISEPTVAG